MLLLAFAVLPGGAQDSPYHVRVTDRVGGPGGHDYVYADVEGRNLYVPRMGDQGRISVYSLDTLDPVGVIPEVRAHGVAVSSRSGHGFASSKPVAMWDSATLALIKTIDVQGSPDGIVYDGFDNSVYVFSHETPNLTKIDAESGTVVGTLDLGGAPEQAVSDGKGSLYVDLEDKDVVAKVDAASLQVVARFGLQGKGGTCAGLAMDKVNQILFVACRNPQTMVILNALGGEILGVLPIGNGCDGASFDPQTGEAFSSQRDGTLSVIREDSPTSFRLEQTVVTMKGARTHTLDTKTDHLFLIGATPGLLPRTDVPDSFAIVEVGKGP